MLIEYFELIKSELMTVITIVGYILILHTLITTILSEIISTLLNFKDKRSNKSKKRSKNYESILFRSKRTTRK